MGQARDRPTVGPHNHNEAPVDMWRAEEGMWQAALVDTEEGEARGGAGGAKGDAGGTAPSAKPGMQEVLAVLKALDAEHMYVSSPAGDSGQNIHGCHQGREHSDQWMTSPLDHVHLSGNCCYLQCKLLFDLIDFAIYFQQKQILTLKRLSLSWYNFLTF